MVDRCPVAGCTRAIWALGLCNKHYHDTKRGIDVGIKPTRARRVKGTGSEGPDGYIHRVVDGRRKRGHQLVAEKALGRPLKPPEEIHHIDNDGLNNTPSNLVICPDRKYHQLLHRRQRALDACGHADWIRCKYCKKHSPPEEVHVSITNPYRAYHRACENKDRRERWAKNPPQRR